MRNLSRIAAVAPALVVVVLAVLGPSLAARAAEQPVGIPFAAPSGNAWLGTDRLGRDVLSRLLYGGWGLLLTAAVIAVVVTVVASVLGAVAALRPRVGAVIELGTDFVILLPAVLGILLVLTSWPDAGVPGLIVLALLFGAPYCARVFAAAAAGVAASGYIEAAQAGGETLPHLVFREMMPNLREVFATQLGLRFVAGVYLVATASFLQLPTTLGATNWAVMVRDNASGLLLNPWAVLAPSLAIAIVAVSVNLAVSEFGRGDAPSTAAAFSGALGSSGRQGVVSASSDSKGLFDDAILGAGVVGLRDDSGSGAGGSGLSDGAVGGAGSAVRDGAVGRGGAAGLRDGSGLAALGGDSVGGTGTAALPGGATGRPGRIGLRDSAVAGAAELRDDPDAGAMAAGSGGDAIAGAQVAGSDGDPVAEGREAGSGRDPSAGAGAAEEMRGRSGEAVVVSGVVVVGSSGQKLLGPVSFHAERGAVIALTGPSGCGKTTLLRLLLGQLPEADARVEGAVTVAGEQVLALGEARLRVFRRDRIAYVGQDPGSALNPLMRVRTLLAEVARDRAAAALMKALEQVGLSAEHLDRRPDELSGGQQRRVALARALVRGTEVLALDEPFAGLHAALRAEIAGVISGIAASGVTVVLTGHDTDTVHSIADQVVELGSVSARQVRDAAAESGDEPIVLRAQGVCASIKGKQVLSGIDFTLGRGSALAVVGASGAGKTTLARVLAGLHQEASGALDLDGTPLPIGESRGNRHVRNGIQLVTQNPKSALNPRRTVGQTLARPLSRHSHRRASAPRRRGSFSTAPIKRVRDNLFARPSKDELREQITALLESVDLDPGLANRYPHELSGGQRQRVALARALAADPAVLLCDEITAALDHETADAIMTLLDRIRTDRGTALLLITHDMTVVAAHCPHTLVLDHGHPVESGPTATILAAPDHTATRELLH
ncbi:ATP-binding cassette domain-containing protein [Nocardia cyriacigeorgica]|uniref:ATP-binding cassette domain-containing protein n=1 Tax=Nocardia cyriacigeorgica TaxID=135487 RepID=UPI002B4B255D|nr:ATP-binding cassette domain-containing protein [Nocardia cyriacigeorgica]